MLTSLDAPLTRDELITELRDCERTVAAARARQIEALQRHTRTLGRTLGPSDLAGVLDISIETARKLLEAAQRTPEKSGSMAKLSNGDWSFDRTAVMASLIGAGADQHTQREAENRDIAGVRKLKALQKRINRRDEHSAHEERSVRTWASLDEAAGFIHAQLTGYDWRVVTKALDDRSDRLPRDLHTTTTATQRRADALVALAHDWLDGRIQPGNHRANGGPIVTVMVDAKLAAPTNGESGATITNGPRIGPETLEQILCEGSVEVLVDAKAGKPLTIGPTTSAIPPKTRRYVLNRDGGCTIDGCNSDYRLEAHHILPRSHHGDHDPDNLTTLCWYHHHDAVHGRGMTIDPQTPSQRRRLLPPFSRPPPRPGG
jgi:hypothetical protein